MLKHTMALKICFQSVHFTHLYREHNNKVDSLAKARVSMEVGLIDVKEKDGVASSNTPFIFL